MAAAMTMVAGMAADPAIVLENVRLTGDLTNGQAQFTYTATVRVTDRKGATLDLLGGDVALVGVSSHPRWRILAEQKRFVLAVDRAGSFPVEVKFQTAVEQPAGWNRVNFTVAPGALQKLTLRGLSAESQFEFPGGARPEREGDAFVSYLPVNGAVNLAWKEAPTEAEGRLFYAAEALAQVTVSPGLLRQTVLLGCKVMQGEMTRLNLLLQGDGEVTRVQGEHVLSWKLVPGTNNLRRLEVTFNQPEKDAFALAVQLQTPLGAFPQAFDAPQLQPEQATRFAGFCRVVNDGAVRLEVLQAGGLSQVSPEQFPMTDSFKSLALPAGGQTFAYRFSGAGYQLRVQADNILPELGVSQLLTYHLAETELSADAEFEVDVREAPLRELNLVIPRGYVVARLVASGMSDYFVTDAADPALSQLRIVYGTPVAGRQVVQLRLERNSPLKETAWTLPRVEVAHAKSVRGHVGATADPGFRLTVGPTQGLTDVATAFFPKKVAGLQVAFRLSEPGWQASLTVERLAQTIQVDGFHLFSVGEGIAYGSSVLNYSIAGAPVSALRVELAEEYFNVEFTGKEIRNWQKADGGYVVQLHTPVAGNYTLLATYERPFKAQGDTLAFTGVRPVEVQSEQGHTIVISAFQFEVHPVNVSSNLLVLEPGEVPPEYRLFFDAPVLAAYRYTTRPFNLQLDLRPLAQGKTVDQVVDRAQFTTRISEEGEVLTDARYFVKSKGATHFRVLLAPDTKLWSASVDGRSVVPVADGQAHLVPLPQQADPNTVLTIDLKAAGRAKSATHMTVTPPAVDAPVLLARWQLSPEAGRRLVHVSGALEPVGRVPDASGFVGVRALARNLSNLRPLLVWAVLLGAALLMFRQAETSGSDGPTGRVRLTFAVGVIAAAASLVVLVMLAPAASIGVPAAPDDLQYLVPVQQAGAAPTVSIANETAKTTFITRWAPAWPALLAVALWVTAAVRWTGIARSLAGAAGWTLALWAALRFPNGGPAAILVFAVALQILVVVPALRRALRRSPGPNPAPTTTPVPTGGAATAAVVLGSLLAVASTAPAHAGNSTNAPAPAVAEALTQDIRVEDGFATVRAAFQWEARRGQWLPVLAEPAVITALQFPAHLAERVEVVENGRRLTGLRARRDGRAEVTVTYQVRVVEREGRTGLILPVRQALVHRVNLTLVGTDADVLASSAVSVHRAEGAGTNTVAALVLAPLAEPWLSWNPRARDTRKEKTVFYVEANQMYVPAAGVLEGVHQLQLRPAQGEIAELLCETPVGMTITDVAAPQLAVWRFDPDARRLRMTFNPPHNRPVYITVSSQQPAGTLPYEQQAGLLLVSGAAAQIGLVGIATGSEVQLEDARGDGFTAINLEDFPAATLAPLQTRVAGLAVRRAFRYADQGGVLTLKVAAVESDVRVESQQTLSLGEDRTVLAANLRTEITRAGIFRLSFELPAGLDVESISGPALSHWTELKGDTGRVITLHLKGKTEGVQLFSVTLSGPGLRAGKAWAPPRLSLREASKQQGQLTIVPEQGMRLQVAERDGLTQLDPAKAGIRQKGVLAFRLLQDPWRLSLDIEQVNSWVQVTSLQDVAVTEGQAKILANLQYDIENTGVKSLRVRLPATAEGVRFKGDQVADFLAQEATAGAPVREWEVKLHRRIIGRYVLQVAYQVPAAAATDRVVVRGVEALDANLQRGFVTVRAVGRLQLRADAAPASLQTAEWQSIPRALQTDIAANAANFTFRLVEPGFELPLTLERREAVKLLAARVNRVDLKSVVSDDGVVLTEARVELTPGDKRLLHLTLPETARFWFAFVNQGSVWPWRATNQILIPLEQHARGEETTVVEFFYSVPTAQAGKRSLNLALAGPKFDLPLENVTWRVFLNGRWQVHDTSGTLQLQDDQLAALAPLDLQSYMGKETVLKAEQKKVAEQMLNLGNSLLQQGDPQQARRAFQKAYGLSQNDAAFNEDARVQLHNLKMQQALVGLNARQAVVAGDTAAPAARLHSQTDGATPAYTQEEAKQILDRNSAEDNAVQLRLAERLVQQQDAAVPNPVAIRASIPEEGRVLTFSRSLLVNEWADLRLNVEARAPQAVRIWPRLGLLAGAFTLLALLALSAKRTRPA